MTDRRAELVEIVARLMFKQNFGDSYGGPDAPYAPMWCDPNGCGPKAHERHKDKIAWQYFEDEAAAILDALTAAGVDLEGQTKRDIKNAPRDGSIIWAHIRDDLPPRWPEREYEDTTSAWADRWAPIKHGGVHTYEDGHVLDMHWTIALPVGYGGITDDWFDDWRPTPPKDKP